MMKETCYKKTFYHKMDAYIQATVDEKLFGDKRKVYWCWRYCNGWHTSRELVNGDAPLRER